jgi:hypothetical protein
MRSGLLSELAIIGYEIFLEGEHVRYRYQKPDTPPESAQMLIDELKKYKAEVVNILKMVSTTTTTEKLQPRANVKASWPPEIQSLVDWFTTMDHPSEPFHLEDHRWIVDPETFFSRLRMDINAGPEGSRGKHGALIHDLMILKRILH